MPPSHDDEPHPKLAHPFTSRIVTVQVLGLNNQLRQNTYRLQLMQWVKDEIVKQAKKQKRWREIDVVLFPGGFLRLSQPIGHLDDISRFNALDKTHLGKRLRAIAKGYAQLTNGISLVVGLDSAPISQEWAGDQLVVSLQNGEFNTLARKAFPVSDDIAQGYPQYIVKLSDVESPFRTFTLRNGAKAILLACYEAFAVRILADKRHYHLNYMKYGFDGNGNAQLLSKTQQEEALNQWLGFLQGEPPNLGLVAIHHFEKAGRDGYWQRHGIAGASAAMRGAPIIGAAHFSWSLPNDLSKSTLASHHVPTTHLNKGSIRLAHRTQPTDGFYIHDNEGYPLALVRLFILKHA